MRFLWLFRHVFVQGINSTFLRLLTILLTAAWFTTSPEVVFGQKSCGTTEYQELLRQKFLLRETPEQFEEWLLQKALEKRLRPQNNGANATQEVLTIPVVVHIIHNGEPQGSGTNLDDSRVFEQIQTLNEDFRRLNADTVNTPLEFQPVAADIEIEFALAVRDPEGLATTGITRTQGPRSSWAVIHNTELKALSYWPAEDYLNIWVAQLDNLLGYAQFPVSGLEGLEIASENRLTDGVVIDTDFFGNNPNSSPESLGRTGTHEIGHYLGLRHVWGDGGCSLDDFCLDTPLANSSNFGCPNNSNSCGSDDMVQNYMDLTDDFCMNLFTSCQGDRMRNVMGFSPRRASLLLSNALTPPVMVANDAGIKEITMPGNSTCSSEIFPQAVVRNYGTNTVNSFIISLLVNNVVEETLTVNATLLPLETTSVSFASYNLIDPSALVSVQITEVNGVADNNAENNTQSNTVSQADLNNVPLTETFEVFPGDWSLRNDDNSLTWEIADAVNELPGNRAIKMNFFDYDNADGEYDYLISPGLDFTNFTDVSLSFKVAYAQFSVSSRDGLIVAVSTDCGNSYALADYVFQESGNALATVSSTSDAFTPTSVNEWRLEELNLNAYAGQPDIRLAFIGINDFGNNLYLDDVNISGTVRPDLDAAITQILEPDLVSCEPQVQPRVIVRNTGLNVIDNLTVSYSIAGGPTQSLMVSGLNLASDQHYEVIFDAATLPVGASEITAEITAVNGSPGDGNAINNLFTQPFEINVDEDVIPQIEEFESTPLWTVINPDGAIGWVIDDAPGLVSAGNQGANLNFFNYTQRGASDYLISQVLDFSQAPTPTLSFDVAYAGSINYSDGLQVLVSTDCGVTFADTVWSRFGIELSTVSETQEFFPSGTNDWQKFTIDLSAYGGLNGIRVALQGVNDFGNNLFIDNLEFFLTDNTFSSELDEDEIRIYPNPTSGSIEISLNLTERQDVEFILVDALGRIVRRQFLENALNQTYQLELPYAAGLYIAHLQGTTFSGTQRIILAR